MGIKINNIIESLAIDVSKACNTLKQKQVNIDIPEIEITLNLEGELEGDMEQLPTIKPEIPTSKQQIQAKRILIDEKTFTTKGITFRRIGTIHEGGKEYYNFTIRIIFTPEEF